MGGDPSNMQNEVKYDVLHTHDIFTNDVGGNYQGTKLIGPSTNGTQIRSQWQTYKSAMAQKDMYVQYSSGHGSQSGLAVGVSYDNMRDFALSLPNQEVVIFTMACYSGNLVSSFNRRRADWQNWGAQGRTLLVMSSSQADEESSTGPGTDPDQPSSPDGSAGSAFGHALWKALIGYADGYVDGVKDGFVSLGEIVAFAHDRTIEIGGHTPEMTGVYSENLVMNKVPSAAFLKDLEGSTEGMSDADIMKQIQALDLELAVK